jgi:tetratricopeptide (TPR) repeat protein
VLAAQQFSVFVAPTAFFFYLTVAMLMSLTPSKASDQQWGSPNRWLLAVASIVFSAYFAFFGLRLLALDRMLARTQHAIEAGNVQDAANAYAQARRWRPGGSSADIYYSRSMMARAGRAPDLASKLEAWKQAGSAAFSAPETSEDPANAWYNLAVFYGVQDDARGAEMSLRRAIACAPNWFKPHWTLAQILRAKGNLAEARQEAELAANLTAASIQK